jgi:hypothetical protein
MNPSFWQAEYASQCQGCLNGKIGIPGLAATDSPPGRMPSGLMLPALPIMSGYRAGEDLPRIPVCHFELHLANAMAAGGMMFERHGSDQTAIQQAYFQTIEKGSMHQSPEGTLTASSGALWKAHNGQGDRRMNLLRLFH